MHDLRLGIIMVGCVPGAMASNVLTLVARGNVSYSLSLTTTATCLSPICVPLMLKLDHAAGASQTVCCRWSGDWVGWSSCRSSPDSARSGRTRGPATWAQAMGKRVAALAILWIIAVVVGVNRDALGTVEPAVLLGRPGLNLAGYGVGRLGGWALASAALDATGADPGDRHAKRRFGDRPGRRPVSLAAAGDDPHGASTLSAAC